MTTIITHLLRRTPILYRSRVAVSSHRRNHQIESSVLASTKNTQYLAQNTNETFNAKPTDLNKLLECLKVDASTLKRVNCKNFQNVVNSAVKDYLSPSDGAFLLQCCTMLPDIPAAQDKSKIIDTIWNDGILRNGSPTKAQIIALLRAYRIIGRTIDDFNSFLAQYDCEGDVELYEEFLWLVCETGAVSDGIVKVLSDIKNRGFPLTENLFNALILGHSKNKSVANCEKVLETMVTANLTPSTETYMHLVRAYIENGDVTKATKLLREQGSTFSQEQSFSIIRTAAVNDSVELLEETMKLLPDDALLNKGVVPGLRNICTELIYMDKLETAYGIVNNLPKIKFTDNEDTDSFGIFFINEMIRHKDDLAKILDIAQRLVDSGRNKRALHCCCELMLRANSPNSLDCLKALSKKESLRPHYFWPLFLQYYHVDGENGILKVLKEMKDLKVNVDQDTVIHYVLARLPITMKNAKHGIKIICDKGVPIGVLLTPVLCHLLHQFKVDEALEIIKLHKTKVDGDLLLWPLITTARKFDTSSPVAAFAELVHTITTRNQKDNRDFGGQMLIETIARSNKTIDASVFVSILERFHTIGIKIPTSTCDQLLGHVQKNLPFEFRKKSTAILRKMLDKSIQANPTEQMGMGKHPRDMTLDEMECHLIELQSKNMNSRGVLRRLLQLLVRAGKLDRALQINQLCKENNVEFSPGMLASILDLMIRTKNLSEAEETFNQLKIMYPTFPVDEFKVIDLASLMIENDRIEEARKILEARAKSKLQGGKHSQKNVWALLSNVAAVSAKAGSSVNQSHEFLEFLIKLGYCSYHNTLHGPIIREYLLKNEIAKAMMEFEKIAAKHKKTPMHFELMTTLIEISNSEDSDGPISPVEAKEMLAKVASTVVSIHGSPNANVSLIVAIAKAGTEAQLRKILMDPKLEFNAELLVKQCEYLSTTGAETTLFKLAKCSRGLGRLSSAFKEQDLYNLLLNEYARGNNFSAALALFERVAEDDDIRMPQDFARRVADLLEKNNLELPSVLQMQLRKT